MPDNGHEKYYFELWKNASRKVRELKGGFDRERRTKAAHNFTVGIYIKDNKAVGRNSCIFSAIDEQKPSCLALTSRQEWRVKRHAGQVIAAKR